MACRPAGLLQSWESLVALARCLARVLQSSEHISLLQAVHAWAVTTGSKGMVLHALLDAIPFWKKMGFVEVEDRFKKGDALKPSTSLFDLEGLEIQDVFSTNPNHQIQTWLTATPDPFIVLTAKEEEEVANLLSDHPKLQGWFSQGTANTRMVRGRPK